MATKLENLPYRKRLQSKWQVEFSSFGITYVGLIAALMPAVFLSRLSLFDWETYQLVAVEGTVPSTPTVTERLVVWAFCADPWFGILWGIVIGIPLILILNAHHRKHMDFFAERLIRRNRIAFSGLSDGRMWALAGWISAFMAIDVIGAYILNVTPKTSAPGLLIPGFLSYRVHRDTYELAKSKYSQALDQGLIPNGSRRPSRLELVNYVGAGLLYLAIPIWFSVFIASEWDELGEIRDVFLYVAGTTRTPDEVQALENWIREHPDDRDTRLILGTYYQDALYDEDDLDQRKVLVENYRRHALWLIEHAPGHTMLMLRPLLPLDGEAYEKARQLWLENIEEHGDDPRVLRNAVEYFSGADEAIAADILRKGAALEPDNPEWRDMLRKLESREESAQ
ncbi:MAG: hypothetical protein KJ060_06180 [Candidatus Hydrogenedentes bacterium]|nr:hypothetical protein [Candidatus Hydrogenedentota bacterium]